MHIIFVDDEISSHINFCHDMALQAGVNSLHCFFTPASALAHAQSNPIDCAFLDIDLSAEMDGIELAKQLKAINPQIEIAFLTAFDTFARDSYQVGGRAYLTKPYSQEALTNALQLLRRLVPPAVESACDQPLVQIRTFGNFDLLHDGRAVSFKTNKAKEALAFLVDKMGSTVSGAQIFFALWDKQEYNATTAIYVRRTMHALRDTLESLGIADILISGRNRYSVDITRLDCDSYTLLRGETQGRNLYNGAYMQQYAWSQNTLPLLDRAAKKES